MKRIQFKLTAVISEYIGIDVEDFCDDIIEEDEGHIIDPGVIEMIRFEEEEALGKVLKQHLGHWDFEFTDVSEIEEVGHGKNED